MVRKLALLNGFSVILVIIISYFANAMRLNNNTIGSLSSQYENLFTPAGYAFSIWSIIYISLIAYMFFQLKRAFKNSGETDFIPETGPWFAIANFANAVWVLVWLYEYTFLSVILMLVVLLSLIKSIINTKMELWDAPLKIIAFVWWPICLYAGWISLATIANIAAYLAKIGWDGWFLTEVQWTLLMIFIAVVLNILVIYKRNMREFALVGVWGLIAIFVRHTVENNLIANVALTGAIIVFIYISYHGYVNRKTSPMHKLMNNK